VNDLQQTVNKTRPTSQSKANHRQICVFGYARLIFFTPVTLTLTRPADLDLNILKMYLHAKNEVSGPRLSNVKSTNRKDRHTDTHRQTRPNALPAAFAGGNNVLISTRLLV